MADMLDRQEIIAAFVQGGSNLIDMGIQIEREDGGPKSAACFHFFHERDADK